MFASNTLELPYYKVIGRQSGRGFGALAQVIGRTAIPFVRKYIVPAANRLGADLLEFAVPEVADVVSRNKNFKTAAKSVGRQTLRKLLEMASRRESFQSKIWSEAAGHSETFLQIMQINNDRSKYFSAPTFCCNFWVSWCESPSCERCDVFSRTRNVSHYIFWWKNSIEFEFQTDRKVYVDLRQTYLALKNKLVKGRGPDTYKTTEKKKEQKEDTVFTETGEDDVEFIEEDEGVPHITDVNNILHPIFSNAELYINNHQI